MRKIGAWRQVAIHYVYKSKWLAVRHDDVIMPNGKRGTYDLVEKQDFVVVIPRIKDRFYLVEQDRYTVRARSLEFPQGHVDKGETMIDAAKREFEEETGLKAIGVLRLGHLWLAPGNNTQGYDVFLVKEAVASATHREESECDMATHVLSEQKLREKIKNGIIKDATTVAAYTLYVLHKKEIW